jgi:tetratricopeptide (TPR) repeat protein
MKTWTVFVSYSAEDSEIAEQLEAQLGEMGFVLGPDRRYISRDPEWPEAIRQAIAASDCVLLLWSQSSEDTLFVECEWTTALDLKKPLALCRIDDAPLHPALEHVESVSLEDFNASFSRFSDGLKGLNEQPAPLVEQVDEGGAATILPLQQQDSSAAALNVEEQATILEVPSPEDAPDFGDRYRVIRMLGRGGMGSVYHVYDTELSRDVALKVIRSDIAENPEILERFKREIQLSSIVTHRNVLRVYDLGESRGIRFLTMQYVEGGNLSALLRREGPLPMERMLQIIHQICQGLKAAHDQGVLHRDLKPDNVMIDEDDRVYLTDFGLAKSLNQTGLTQAGQLMGTPDYMSPEQVKGEPLDARSDIYSLGAMLYQMATGQVPFTGQSVFEVMMQRIQKPPRPPEELNPDIPLFLKSIIERSMAREKEARYSDVNEMLVDLEAGMSTGKTSSGGRFYFRQLKGLSHRMTRQWALFLVSLLLLGGFAGWGWWDRENAPAASVETPREPVTVLVSDFDNRTGEKLFSGAAEEMLGESLEGAPFISVYSRGQARKIAIQLEGETAKLNEDSARLVAQREGISVVISGVIAQDGGKYTISVSAVDAVTGDDMDKQVATASSKADVLGRISRISAQIRRKLGDTTPESAQLLAAESFTASSLEAAQACALGQEYFGEGRWEEAITEYQKAIRVDPSLGRAHAGLAAIYRNDGKTQQAEQEFQLAMKNIDRMSERERFKTRGGYFLVTGNYAKAVEEFQTLLERYPADFVGRINLALSYFLMRKTVTALETARQAIKIYPKNVMAQGNLALYAMYAGDFDGAIAQAGRILESHPDYGDLYLCMALSELARGKPESAAENYRKLAAKDAWGASVASTGFADLALYEGRLQDAVDILTKGIAVDQAAQDNPAAARKMLYLADALLQLRQKERAVAEAQKALGLNRQPVSLYQAALIYLRAGRPQQALDLAGELIQAPHNESKMYGLLVQGEVRLASGEAQDALRFFRESSDLADSWLGRYSLGRAYLESSAFPEAYSEFERCLNRRGEATAVFLDDIPSYHYFPAVYYLMGRAQQGLGSPGSLESYRAFLDIRGKARQDPMVADVRQRLESPSPPAKVK